MKKNGSIHSIQNQKGGVGKSTFSNAFAYEMAKNGKKVALVDADPQATQTGAFMGFPYGNFSGEHPSNIANIFNGKPFEPIVITASKYIDNPEKKKFAQSHYIEEDMTIDFYPSNYELLDMIECDEFKKDEKVQILADFFESLRDKYDVVIIDSPPTFGIITTAILMCSNTTVMSIPTKNVDTDGMVGYFRQLDKAYVNYDMKNLKKIVVLPNMYNKIAVDAKYTLKDIKHTPNLLQSTKQLKSIKCVVAEPFPQRAVIQEAPSTNSGFLVPYIMDYSRSKNSDLLLMLEKLTKEVFEF